MYSRNQNRVFDDDDYEDEEFDDEYEFYRYNLPPNYDGNRFQRPKKRINPPHLRHTEVLHDTVSHDEESKPTNDTVHTEKSSIVKLLNALGGRFGYEEMLIISLILILTAEKNCGDIVLLLALLLIAN